MFNVWFKRVVFGVDQFNCATVDFQKSKMAADGYFGYTKMDITWHPIDAMFGYTAE